MADIFLRSGAPNPADVILRDPTAADTGGSASDSTVPPTYAFIAAVPGEAVSQATTAPAIVWTVAAPGEAVSQATTAPAIVWTVAAPGEAVSQATTAPAIVWTVAAPGEGIAVSDSTAAPAIVWTVAAPTEQLGAAVAPPEVTSGRGFTRSPKAWERPPFSEPTVPPMFRLRVARPTEEIVLAPPATVPEIFPSVLGGRYVATVPIPRETPPAPAPVLRVLTFAEDEASAAECRFEPVTPEEGFTLRAAEPRPVRDVYRLARNKDRLVARGDRLAWRRAA